MSDVVLPEPQSAVITDCAFVSFIARARDTVKRGGTFCAHKIGSASSIPLRPTFFSKSLLAFELALTQSVVSGA